MKATTENQAHVSHDAIANLARQIWEREGRQSGRDVEYWLRAERELLANQSRSRSSASGPATAGTNNSAEANRAQRSPALSGRTIRI